MRVCLRVLVKSIRRRVLALGVTWQVRAVYACRYVKNTNADVFMVTSLLNKTTCEEQRNF
jgi:hypothetical protein